MNRVLFIQSGHTDKAAKSLKAIHEKVFPCDTSIDYLADDVHDSLHAGEIPELSTFFLLKPGILQALLFLFKLWRTKYNTVVVLFTRESGFLKHKAMALLTRRKRLLIFNENADCFFYTHHMMYRHLRWRWVAYLNSPRSGNLRSINNGLKVLKNEGFRAFATKSWNLLNTTKRVKFHAKLRKDIGALLFPQFEKPRVSVIIPVYNKVLYTQNCLVSIVETTPDVAYEVIVVDDNSTDTTPQVLSEMKNLQIIRSAKNQGFVGSCNAGAAAARGDYILFLNNDTTVTPGWLSTLVDTLDRDQSCGIVGSKLIYPDGRLQEAGGIIWQDASGWNYGKFDDPNKPEFNYVRHVDYCSGAALMIRRELFERVGGLDRRYAPAYWEDTDLCFSVRELGYRVLYQPASVVVHHEGVSAGTSTSSGMKRFQMVNTEKFVEKWSKQLAERYVNDPANAFLARDLNRGKWILVVDHYVPTYDKDAGSFFMYSLLKSLAELGYRVVFWPDNLFRSEPYTAVLQQMGIEVIYGRTDFAEYLNKYGKFFSAGILTRNHIAINYIDQARASLPNIIYHDPDYEYLREKRRFELEGGDPADLQFIKDREEYIFEKSDVITTVSEEEAVMLRNEMPGKTVVTIHHPIAAITDMVTPFAAREDLLFVGSSHPPNTDAVVYYATELMPLLHGSLPGVRLYAVGGNPHTSVQELASDHLIVTGFVNDLAPYFEKCRVYVAPLRYGAGVKGKIIEAMSFGLPIVTTSVGAEGLGLSNREQVLIADDQETLVESIRLLYTDQDLWHKLSENSKSFADRWYSQRAFKEKIKSLMEYLDQYQRGSHVEHLDH